jgi:ubiquitin-conjugating enzyme E2 R
MSAGTSPASSSVRALTQELRKLTTEPVEGFQVTLVDDDNIFDWNVTIFGPPETLLQGGYFKARMSFPKDYPYSPPTFRFETKLLHPNIYESGEVCISILHPPGEDAMSGESPAERWNPTQSVRTILLSVISLLNEPNTSSPANVDASVMYRKWKEGKDNQYERIVRQQVESTQEAARRDGVTVPKSLAEYCIQSRPELMSVASEEYDFYDDDYNDDDDDEEEEVETDGDEEADDSGNAEL